MTSFSAKSTTPLHLPLPLPLGVPPCLPGSSVLLQLCQGPDLIGRLHPLPCLTKMTVPPITVWTWEELFKGCTYPQGN